MHPSSLSPPHQTTFWVREGEPRGSVSESYGVYEHVELSPSCQPDDYDHGWVGSECFASPTNTARDLRDMRDARDPRYTDHYARPTPPLPIPASPSPRRRWSGGSDLKATFPLTDPALVEYSSDAAAGFVAVYRGEQDLLDEGEDEHPQDLHDLHDQSQDSSGWATDDFRAAHSHNYLPQQPPETRPPSPRPRLSYADWKQQQEDWLYNTPCRDSPPPQPLYRHTDTPEDMDCGIDAEPVAVSASAATSTAASGRFLTDDEAVASVTQCLFASNRRHIVSRHARILQGLIHPKCADAEFELDDHALDGIFLAANAVFFDGRLAHRVRWSWSDGAASADAESPSSNIIGHTALRRARDGGFETYILLSTPILKSRAYNRRLLISAFLHELIHCFLFICCGWSARAAGGHTDGFRAIANMIDDWAGREHLHLCHIEADLERFRRVPASAVANWGDLHERLRGYDYVVR